MRCSKVIEILEKQSPRKFACDWDNVGLLVGRTNKEIQKIYIALDATDEAIQQAVDVGADMLLTHHPMIFGGMKRVTAEDTSRHAPVTAEKSCTVAARNI